MTDDTAVEIETWEKQFQPVLDAGAISGRQVSVRPQQAQLGQAMIDAITLKKPLIAECPTGTGKSVGYLVPLIHAVRGKEGVRAAVSTETLALQDQIARKDLPFLASIYPGFTYRLLKGRNNYVCFENADLNSRANLKIRGLYDDLMARISQMGDGELRDAERILGREIDAYTWSFISGSTTFCAENACNPEKCFSTRARALALDADIVVINHSLLQIEAEMKSSDTGGSILGDLTYTVVDEAHRLEDILVDGWTESISEWELNELHGSVSKGLDKARSLVDVGAGTMYETEQALDGLNDALASIQKFYQYLNPDEEWRRHSSALCEKRVFGGSESRVISAMHEVEDVTPKRLKRVVTAMETVQKLLRRAAQEAEDQQVKGRRELRKGARAAGQLMNFCTLIGEALATKDGVVMWFGMPNGVSVHGFERRDGRAGVRIQTVPIDVSSKIESFWKSTTPILISATLTDLTDGTFNYLKASLGFPEAAELKTGSPFDYQVQQRTYITPADRPKIDNIAHAQYSFDELVDFVNAAGGRTLVLFTARGELDDCAQRMLQLRADGNFNHPILVQEKDSNKQRLVDDFKDINSSVLLATKSFFTGVDFPGDTCSAVAICKFPLERFDVVCRQRMQWWVKRGFPRWYERAALQVFQQAAGRLIRTGTDKGIVAILDQRVVKPDERVYQTARIGVDALGSQVIRSTEDVRTFLATS